VSEWSFRWSFTSLDWFTVTGRGRVAVVANPVDFERGACPFLGKQVTIDGSPYVVRGVESHALPVIRQGAHIGLLVREGPTEGPTSDSFTAETK
jgi:hypothetical protein